MAQVTALCPHFLTAGTLRRKTMKTVTVSCLILVATLDIGCTPISDHEYEKLKAKYREEDRQAEHARQVKQDMYDVQRAIEKGR
jgi:hypothetical protein